MYCPIRAESGKGRSAHIFNLNERAVVKSAEKPLFNAWLKVKKGLCVKGRQLSTMPGREGSVEQYALANCLRKATVCFPGPFLH